MTNTQNHNGFLLALLAFIVVVVVYFLWTPYVYTGDDLQQSIVIQENTTGVYYYHPAGGRLYEPGLTADFNPTALSLPVIPRYLLEYPTSISVANLAYSAGLSENIMPPILIFRGLVGGLGVLFLVLAVYDLTANGFAAMISGLGMGTTLAYWTYSSHIDQSINMMTILCLAFYVLVRMRHTSPRWGGKILLAAILAFASFYNFTAVFTTIAFGVGVALLHRDETLLGKFKQLVIFGVIYAVMVIGVIVLAVAVIISPAAVTDSEFWSGVLFAGKPEYNVGLVQDTLRAVLGFAKSQIALIGVTGSLQAYWDSADGTAKMMLLAFYGTLLAVMTVPVLVLAAGRRRSTAEKDWLWVTLGLTFVLHSVFNWFWDPGFIKYWLIPLACWWIMAGMFVDYVKHSLTSWYRLVQIAIVSLIAVTFTVNLLTQFLPESRPAANPWLSIAEDLKESQPSDLFISDSHPLDFHIAYFTHRNILATDLILYAGVDEGGLNTLMQEQIQRHRDDDGEVYVYTASGDLERMAAFLGLDSVDQFEAAWTFPELVVYRVNGL